MKMVVALLNLTKFRLCAAVAFSAAAGFVIARREITSEIFAPALGTFLLACGCCGLNQFQERKIDARMERTSRRPLPARKMKPGTALSISLGLMALGLSVLFLKAHVLAGALGLFAALLYNGVYARLKPRTTLAVIPGAMVGAVPPTIGWVSGGEALLQTGIGALCVLFFLWQVPHCWLLFLKFSEQYRKAGLPTPCSLWTPDRTRRIISVWMFATAVSSLLLPRFLPVYSHFTLIALLAASLWLIGSAALLVRPQLKANGLTSAYIRLNIYVFFVMSFLSLDRLWPRGL